MTTIISFYSYFGGVEKPTTLFQLASKLLTEGKKVVIIDADFKTPFAPFVEKEKTEKESFDGIYEFNKKSARGLVKGSVEQFGYNAYINGSSVFVLPTGNSYFIDNLGYYKTENLFIQLITKMIDDMEPDFILVNVESGLNNISNVLMGVASDIQVFVTQMDTLSVKTTAKSMRAFFDENKERGDIINLPFLFMLPAQGINLNSKQWASEILPSLQRVAQTIQPMLKERMAQIKENFTGLEVSDLQIISSVHNTKGYDRLAECILFAAGYDIDIQRDTVIDTIALTLKNISQTN